MSVSTLTIFKYVSLVNKIRKAVDLKDFSDLERFINTMFKDAPEDLKAKIKEVVNRARKYAESGRNVDLLDIAEDLLAVFGVTGAEAEDAAKTLTEIAKTIAEEISKEVKE